MVAEGDARLEDRISTCDKVIAALSSGLKECNSTKVRLSNSPHSSNILHTHGRVMLRRLKGQLV